MRLIQFGSVLVILALWMFPAQATFKWDEQQQEWTRFTIKPIHREERQYWRNIDTRPRSGWGAMQKPGPDWQRSAEESALVVLCVIGLSWVMGRKNKGN